MSVFDGILRNLLSSLFTKIFVALCNLLILLVTARYLGVSSRGEISIFLLNIALVQLLCEVFTGYNIVHFVPRYSLSRIIGFGLLFAIAVCTAVNFGIVIAGKQVPGYEWTGWVTSLLVIFHSFNCMLLLGHEKVSLFNALALIQPFLLFCGIVVFIFVLRDLTFTAYLFPLLISFSLALCLSVPAVWKCYRRRQARRGFNTGTVLTNGLVLQSAALMYIFANRYNFYLLQGSAEVGLYASAVSLMEGLLLLAVSVSPVLIARVANLGDHRGSALITLSLARLSLIFGLLPVLILLVIPDSFFVMLLGGGFSGIRNIMLLYAPGVLMIAFFMPLSTYFSAIGKQKLILPYYALGFLLTIVFAPVLVNGSGVRGAALSAVIAYFAMGAGIVYAFFRFNALKANRLWRLQDDLSLVRQWLKPAAQS